MSTLFVDKFLLQVSKKLNVKQEELSSIFDGFKEQATIDLESVTVSSLLLYVSTDCSFVFMIGNRGKYPSFH